MDRAPVWNRRKEILIGTQAKVSPATAMARRASLVCQVVGKAAGYYFWMVSRLRGQDDHTRFKIKTAAAENNLSIRTVKYYNKRLAKLGFITIINRSWQRRNTYSEYTLNPINDIIKDYGVVKKQKASKTVQKLALPGSAKTCTAKRSLFPVQRASLSRSSTLPEAAKQAKRAVASPPAPRPSDPQGIDISSWFQQNLPWLLESGFKPQAPSQFKRDVDLWTQQYDEPQQAWNTFLELVPRLQIQLPLTFIKKRKHNLSPGWLFKPSKHDPEETNFEVITFSLHYGGVELPQQIFIPGITLYSRDPYYGNRPFGVIEKVIDEGYCIFHGNDQYGNPLRSTLKFSEAERYQKTPPTSSQGVA